MKPLVLMRGGGDIASGAVYRLRRAGYPVVISEIAIPTMIRREVCYGNAVHRGEMILERFVARHVSIGEVKDTLAQEIIPVVTSSYEELLDTLKPEIVVDAILSKKNLGTKRDDADLVIGVGPGFIAGEDVDVVIETMRGHNLGKLIFEGKPMANTGIPGIIKGVGKERVIYSPCAGVVKNICKIGDMVEKNQVIATVDGVEVLATISGVLRGLIREGYEVPEKFKMADIDPREEEQANCFTISDKARAIGGAVLEAVLYLKNEKNI